MKTPTYLAADFGGGSGRIIAGTLDGDNIKLEEIYRFPNRQIQLGKHLYWDFLALFEEMKTGLKLAAQKGLQVESIGIDTWGVDFGLIDRNGNLLGNPICYRDARTQGVPSEVFKKIDIQSHYAEAGIQIMDINTIFQLYSAYQENAGLVEQADKLLFMPDLFSFYLTGKANNEYCIASTSELLDARKRTWNFPLIQKLGLPTKLFGEIVQPGTVRGTITPEIAEETGLSPTVKVIAVGSHDTASAVFAVPYKNHSSKGKAYLSSGTWSLLGVELDEPILTEEARMAGCTNEGGVGGKIRFLQNITGLWILQCLMKEWKDAGNGTDYATLVTEAEEAETDSLIDVDDPIFQKPENMEKAIAHFCENHGQIVPRGRGEIARCVLASLAKRYKRGIEEMNAMLPEPIKELHIIGGGSQNKLLNRLTEEATGIPVIAGPVEATAIGNIMVQAMANTDKSKF